MFRFWLFGAIISTTAINALYTGISNCIGKCVLTSTRIQYLPHQQCDKFCVCVCGQPQVMPCKPGEHWSKEQEICTHPAEAKCQTWNNTTISINALDQGCKSECLQNVSLAHNDCTKLCLCNNNSIIALNCSKDYFSEKNNMCATVKDGNCIINNSAIITTRLSTELNISVSTDNKCIGSCPKLEDPSHSVYLAHHDCSKYCHCQEGHSIIKNCLYNFLFSLKDMRCRLPNDVDCDRVNSTTTINITPSDKIIKKGCRTQCPRYYNALIPHKRSSKFCLCRDGEVIIIKCPRGYYFSTNYTSCIKRSKCKLIKSRTPLFTIPFLPTTTVKSFPLISLPLSTEPLPSLTEPLLTSTEPFPPSTVGMIEEFNNCVANCPDSDSDFYDEYHNISHKECNKYCECYKGNITKVGECSAGDNFDKFFKACVLLVYAGCDYHDSFASSTTPLSTSSTELPMIIRLLDNESQCLENCTEIEFKNYDIVVNIPHEKCNKYCECHRGEIKVKECPPTHQFDWIHRKCIISENASCLNYTISMTTSSILSISSKDLAVTFSPPVIDYYDCVEACPSISSVNYDEYVKIPHRDCKKYCECYKGILTVVECPIKSYYDCYFQMCDVFKYATCYNQYNISSTSMPLDPSAAPPETIKNCIGKCSEDSKMNYAVFLRHKQCQKFCECFNGRLTVNSCPPNSYFNSNLGLCDQLEYVECGNVTEIPSISAMTLPDINDCLGVCKPDDVYLIPHKHCIKYCECNLGDLDVKSCPISTYFNSFTRICEFTEFDDCTKIFETSVKILPEYTDDCAEECPHFTNETHVVFIPHNQCEKYCLCGRWEKPLVMSCGPNSHFNPTRKKCDYIENAGCKGIFNMNTTFAPHISALSTNDCTGYHNKSKLYTILLKISGIENGSKIDLKIENPDNTVSISHGDDDEMNPVDFHDLIKKDIDEEHIFPKDPNGLVTILANLREQAQCIGDCPEPYVDMTATYLKHQNCQRACKCTIDGLRVMECHNNFYWNPVTQECDPIIYPGCTEVIDNFEDEPKSDSLFDKFKKFMGL